MKKITPFLIATFAVCTSISAAAAGKSTPDHVIRGYTQEGKYIPPSHATNPNNTKADNYSQKGNVNPYTGKPGTKN